MKTHIVTVGYNRRIFIVAHCESPGEAINIAMREQERRADCPRSPRTVSPKIQVWRLEETLVEETP